jgi:endonuclease/exonuclease/phosphatase family metal-dependent hydrolase
VCDKTPRNDALILLGDFNANIVKEHSNKRVAGSTLHDITSENREKLVQLAIAYNLEINSTKFPHRRIHKGNWKASVQDTSNKIDHTLINKREHLQSLMFVYLEDQIVTLITILSEQE